MHHLLFKTPFARTVNEIEMEQTEIDVDDLGDDYREAMDVEDALKHEHEPEDEEIRHRGLHRSADDTGPLLTDSKYALITFC